MTRWFQIAVVALLAVIALELGGSARIADWWRSAARQVRTAGVPPEDIAPPAPGAPRGGIDAFYQKEIDANLDAQVAAQAAQIAADRASAAAAKR